MQTTEAGPGDLRLHEIHSLQEMEGIGGVWNRLALQDESATPFQTWEWNLGMVKSRAGRVRPRIVLAEDAKGEVVGIAPFWSRSGGLPGLTLLEFIGTGRSDYLGLLACDRHRGAFLSGLREWIQRAPGWRVLSLRNLRRESADLLGAWGPFETRAQAVCWFAELPGSLEEYEKKTMQKRLLRKIRHSERTLGEAGRLAWSPVRTASELDDGLTAFFDLHQRRQRSKGERGRFFDPVFTAKFREMSVNLWRAGFLRTSLLRIDGRPAAALYSLRLRDREYECLSGMDPALSEHRPTHLLRHRVIGRAIEEGVRLYDLMGGSEPYKAMWTDRTAEIFEMERARTRFEARAWRRYNAWREGLVRSRLLKRVYLKTLGRFRHASRRHAGPPATPGRDGASGPSSP